MRSPPAEFYIVSGTPQTLRDLDWITRNIQPVEHAELVDVTNAYSVIGVMGPKSRCLLSRVTDTDLSTSPFPFLTAQIISVGMATARAGRLTYLCKLALHHNLPRYP